MPYEEVEIPDRGSVDHTATYKNHVYKQNFRNKRIKMVFFQNNSKTVKSLESILSNT